MIIIISCGEVHYLKLRTIVFIAIIQLNHLHLRLVVCGHVRCLILILLLE